MNTYMRDTKRPWGVGYRYTDLDGTVTHGTMGIGCVENGWALVGATPQISGLRYMLFRTRELARQEARRMREELARWAGKEKRTIYYPVRMFIAG